MEIARALERFSWQVPEVALSFAEGLDALSFFQQMQTRIAELGDPTCLTKAEYDAEIQSVTGANFPISVLADNIARQNGMRGAMPYDENKGPLKEMVRGKHYVVFPCLDIRSAKHTRDSNRNLLTRVMGLVEEAEGKVEFPFRISGFGLEQQEEGYGLNVIPRDGDKSNLTIVHNDRLLGKYDGSKFEILDAQGLPVFNDDGTRTWHAKQDGASVVYLDSDLDMGSDDSSLSYSGSSGRGILVSGEADASGKEGLLKQINQRAESGKAKIDRAVQAANAAYEEVLSKE